MAKKLEIAGDHLFLVLDVLGYLNSCPWTDRLHAPERNDQGFGRQALATIQSVVDVTFPLLMVAKNMRYIRGNLLDFLECNRELVGPTRYWNAEPVLRAILSVIGIDQQEMAERDLRSLFDKITSSQLTSLMLE